MENSNNKIIYFIKKTFKLRRLIDFYFVKPLRFFFKLKTKRQLKKLKRKTRKKFGESIVYNGKKGFLYGHDVIIREEFYYSTLPHSKNLFSLYGMYLTIDNKGQINRVPIENKLINTNILLIEKNIENGK